MIDGFPPDVKTLMQIPLVVYVDVLAEECGIPFEILGSMDVQLGHVRS